MKAEKSATVQNKTRSRRQRLIVILVLLLIAIPGALIFKDREQKKPAPKPYDPPFRREGILHFIRQGSGDTISRLTIEIAEGPDETTYGLMYRRSMPDSLGMLFIFPEEKELSFWMRNTYISLDMFFVTGEGRIVSIHENAKPLSEENIPSGGPAIYAVETVAGYAGKFDIQPGDAIIFERDSVPAAPNS